jgi:hypothetical protein
MNSRDRDEFYLSKATNADGDDGDDYELEPPDAEVLAAEERRGREAIDATHATIDIDEIYRDAGRQRADELLESWFKDFRFRFRFQVKHLLIATAVLAIVLTLAKLQMLGTVAVLLVMFSVAGMFFYLQWQEKKAEDEATQRRHEMYERRRTHFDKMQGKTAAATAKGLKAGLPLASRVPAAADAAWEEAVSREPFRFRFSMSQMMIAMTTAAVVLGLLYLLGTPSNTATLLGFVALSGLVAHALGFEPPSIVVLGWWLILVLYVLLSILAAVFPQLA